jgi:hydrogenase/urease accessory protein HupE
MKRLAWMLCLAALVTARPVSAHPVPFSFVDVRLAPDALDVVVVAHMFDLGHDLDVAPPERLLEPPTLASKAAGIADLVRTRLRIGVNGVGLSGGKWSAPEILAERQSIQLRARFALDSAPATVTVSTLMFPYDPVHQTFINFYERDEVMSQAILDVRRTDIEYFAGTRQGVIAVMRKFAPDGIRHMLSGPEHLMFLFGLLLMGGSIRYLALVATAFTAAQALTLALAAFNVMTPSLRFVEPGIALSIIYIGADNLMVRGGRDVRIWIAAAFGFIHGFGFAGVLRAMDLSRGALGWSLFSFNLGVEIAQLLVVVVLATALAALRARSERAARQLAFAGSIVVIAAGTLWFVRNVFFPGGMA